MNNPEKEITDKQAAFLEALLGEARENIRAAEIVLDIKDDQDFLSRQLFARRNNRACWPDARYERSKSCLWYC